MSYNVCITKAVVSPGYDKTEALKFSDSGEAVRFRVGIPHYDANAENNTFWENETVKAFGSVCEQIKKMKLKEGSWITIVGEKIFDSWEDEEEDEEEEDEDEEEEEEEEDEEDEDEEEEEEEEVTGEDLAEMDFEALEDLCDDKDLDTDPDDYEEEDIEKLRKAIAKELGINLPKAKKSKKK